MVTLPTEEVKRAASLLPAGRALDIACGNGRHAVWLQRNGWQVTAVDRNAEAIAHIRTECPAIDARVMDLEKEALPEAIYDLVVCWLYFQRDLYPRICGMVRNGGVVALSVLRQGRFAATPEELRAYFGDWTIRHEAQTERTYELVVQLPS